MVALSRSSRQIRSGVSRSRSILNCWPLAPAPNILSRQPLLLLTSCFLLFQGGQKSLLKSLTPSAKVDAAHHCTRSLTSEKKQPDASALRLISSAVGRSPTVSKLVLSAIGSRPGRIVLRAAVCINSLSISRGCTTTRQRIMPHRGGLLSTPRGETW